MGMALGLLLHHGYRFLRKREGLGYGDVKFFSVAGLWLTPFPMVIFLFLAGVFGVVFGLLWRVLGKGEYFPFGPALAVSLAVCVLWPAAGSWFLQIGSWVQSIL
jgi:prepilin signal peptidase PulO-like enzyme (type II secretory pathway)